MAELYGRSTGVCGGKGGSMHFADFSRGFLGGNGIVAGGLPTAVGAALGRKLDGTDDVAVAFMGEGAVNQGVNLWAQKLQFSQNMRNYYLNDKLERVEVSNVQQISDRAFFKRGKNWIDGRLVRRGEFKHNRTVTLGSPEYQELLKLLIRRGRQAMLSLKGDILLKVDGEVIRIINR